MALPGYSQQPTPQSEERSLSNQTPSGLTWRSVALGLLLTGCVDLWIHWAELILGGRGHTALANGAVPIGAFNVLIVLAAVNLFLTRFLRRWAFSPAELLVIYAMMIVSTVISSSGGLHFIVPTITAAFYYANESNGWAGKFHAFIPDWIAQKNADALKGFYLGNASVPWSQWARPMFAWIVFMALFALATLCLAALLRRQWVDRERLSFPTVTVPLEMIRDSEGFFRNRLLWFGFALPFCLDVVNTIHLNLPSVPYFPTRNEGQFDVGGLFTAAPWNAIGQAPLSFYPFVLGIAYLLPVDMTFSCVFFWLLTKFQAVFGAASGISAEAVSGSRSEFPFIGQQGAGAFLALALVGLWMARGYLQEAWRIAFQPQKAALAGLSDAQEPMSYRLAFLGLLACVVGMVVWCVVAGMRAHVALTLIALALCYALAAARIRAETGNAWLFGPNIDAYRLMTGTFGTLVYQPADLTVLAYVRNAIASFDLRCLSVPNQFDAFKMADAVGVSKRRLAWALVVAIVGGIAVSFAIGLMIWYGYGANAKTDAWRTSMGRMPFDQLSDTLSTPIKRDLAGTVAVGAGFGVTAALMALRTRFTWWTFHPVGYAMANTNTMNQVWTPFFLAWAFKVLILRYGGLPLYRQSLPFFFGLIVGDCFAGGLTTLIGCFTGINVYPINW